MTSASASPESQIVSTVSPRAAKALTDAITRLLAGRPLRTDGRLVKENLYKEAEVSRATMNRATDILAHWDTAVSACVGATPGEARRDTEIDALRRKLTAKNGECTLLTRRLDAAATAIAALHHDNSALRDELTHHRNATVVPFPTCTGKSQP